MHPTTMSSPFNINLSRELVESGRVRSVTITFRESAGAPDAGTTSVAQAQGPVTSAATKTEETEPRLASQSPGSSSGRAREATGELEIGRIEIC